ncbi:hypothetical protein [Streptomyces sp. NPDC059970]|uniref:hypothetical protein n=1 Tax=Streptomyces sp. NPDC059970 TaxID=3347019 RepID=UPI003683E56F
MAALRSLFAYPGEPATEGQGCFDVFPFARGRHRSPALMVATHLVLARPAILLGHHTGRCRYAAFFIWAGIGAVSRVMFTQAMAALAVWGLM